MCQEGSNEDSDAGLTQGATKGERMKIESHDRSIGDLLTSGYYVIPRFQRPYSWDSENVAEFWNDTIVNESADYFIGSMVVYTI